MTRCLTCGANCTNMALIPVIQRHQRTGRIETAYELSTYGATLQWLQRNIPQVTTSEYFPKAPLGAVVNGLLNQDVQQLTFPGESFDLVTSNQVFEHVPDDIRGYAECYRVLRPGGALIFSVPMHDFPATQKIAEVLDGRTIIYEPEFHDSRLGGPKSALTFWRHSVHDLALRVASVGFHAELIDVQIARNREAETKVIYAIKR
jgi:SAM-dependent methyltransferase